MQTTAPTPNKVESALRRRQELLCQQEHKLRLLASIDHTIQAMRSSMANLVNLRDKVIVDRAEILSQIDAIETRKSEPPHAEPAEPEFIGTWQLAADAPALANGARHRPSSPNDRIEVIGPIDTDELLTLRDTTTGHTMFVDRTIAASLGQS